MTSGTSWLRLFAGLAVIWLLLGAVAAKAETESPLPCAVELAQDQEAVSWSQAATVLPPADDHAQRPANPSVDMAFAGSEIAQPAVPLPRRRTPVTWLAGGAAHDLRHGFAATGPPV